VRHNEISLTELADHFLKWFAHAIRVSGPSHENIVRAFQCKQWKLPYTISALIVVVGVVAPCSSTWDLRPPNPGPGYFVVKSLAAIRSHEARGDCAHTAQDGTTTHSAGRASSRYETKARSEHSAMMAVIESAECPS
jgi:hypothetical protein